MTTTKKATGKKSTAKPAAAAPKRPAHLRLVKGLEQQQCAGACRKWLPLDRFARKSAARGGGPIRRCKTCITAERQAKPGRS